MKTTTHNNKREKHESKLEQMRTAAQEEYKDLIMQRNQLA